MATYTLRPLDIAREAPFPHGVLQAVPVGVGTVMPWTGLDDDEAGTYWQFLAFQEGYRSYAAFTLDALPTLSADERVEAVQVRVRAAHMNFVPAGSFLTTQLFLAGGRQPTLAEVDVMARPPDEFTPSNITGARWTLDPDGEPWTAQSLANLRVGTYSEGFTPTAPQSWPDNTPYYTYPIKLYELFVDVFADVAPTVKITAPSGDQTYQDGASTDNDATFTSATASFVAGDVGVGVVGLGRADDQFADGSGSSILLSPTAVFTADDLGLEVRAGDYLPDGSAISEIIDATHARLTHPLRQLPRTVADVAYYPRYEGATFTIVATQPIIGVAQPGVGRSFVDFWDNGGASDIGRTISGPGIPEGTTIVSLYNGFGTPGSDYSYYATLSQAPTRTLFNVQLDLSGDIVNSELADFVADDVGAVIDATYIPEDSVITAVIDEHAVRISTEATEYSNQSVDRSLSIGRAVPATAPVSFTMRSRLAIPSGTTIASRTSATEVELSAPARLTVSPQLFTLVGRPETITDVNRPLIQATFEDTEGDTIQTWRVRVFTSAQWGAAGFSPDSAMPTDDSGELEATGVMAEYRVTTALPDATSYRAYVSAADDLGYGTWSYVAFTIAAPLPSVPTLSSVVGDSSLAKVSLSLLAAQGISDAFTRAGPAPGNADTGEAWADSGSEVWEIVSNKLKLVTSNARVVTDGVTSLSRTVTDGRTQTQRTVTDGVTSIARTVTDGVTTVGRTVTDGVLETQRVLTPVYRKNIGSGLLRYGSYGDAPGPNDYQFSAADIGQVVSGTGIPGGTTITALAGATDGAGNYQAAYTSANCGDSTTAIAATVGSGTRVNSATAVFVAGDVGKPISGGSIPVGTTITTRVSATQVILSAVAGSAASGVTLHIGGIRVTSATAVFVAGDVGKPISGGTIPGGAVVTARISATDAQISLPATSAASSVSVTLAGTLLTSATVLFTSVDEGKPVTGTNIPAATTIASVPSSNMAIMSAAATGSGTAISVTVGDDNIVTSATAVFVAGDVGKPISGGTIPAGTTVSSRTSATEVVISAGATADATGVTLVIGVASTTVSSATAAFTASDNHRLISGSGIPAGAYIASVDSATAVTLSVAATAAATGVSITIKGNEFITVPTGKVDLDVVVTVVMGTDVGVTGRHLNADNCLFLRLTLGAAELWKRDAGIATLLATAPVTLVTGTSYEFMFRTEGREIAGFVNDVEVVSHTLTLSEKALFTGATYTRAGVRSNADLVSTVDDVFIAYSALHVLAERSIDGGVTWHEVRPSEGWPVTGLTASTAYDYEAHRRTNVYYRLRASRHSEAPVYSVYSANSSPVTLTAVAVWLKDPLDPAMSITLARIGPIDEEALESDSVEAQTIEYAEGRGDPIVRSSVVRTETFGSLLFFFANNAAYAAFEALRAQMRTVLLQTTYGDDPADQYYLRLGTRKRRAVNTTASHMGSGQWRTAEVEAVEVTAPDVSLDEVLADTYGHVTGTYG